jgi:hypothetical protein
MSCISRWGLVMGGFSLGVGVGDFEGVVEVKGREMVVPRVRKPEVLLLEVDSTKYELTLQRQCQYLTLQT